MLYINEIYNTLSVAVIYLIVYDLSLIWFFWLLYQCIATHYVTIYSFMDLKSYPTHLLIITGLLLSMAGIPPLLGFFPKMLILAILTNSRFGVLYVFFFTLLFFGVYFYLQNIRFLYTTAPTSHHHHHLPNMRINIYFYHMAILFAFCYFFGFLFFIDLVLLVDWLLF